MRNVFCVMIKLADIVPNTDFIWKLVWFGKFVDICSTTVNAVLIYIYIYIYMWSVFTSQNNNDEACYIPWRMGLYYARKSEIPLIVQQWQNDQCALKTIKL